jgi:hypothetical protein
MTKPALRSQNHCSLTPDITPQDIAPVCNAIGVDRNGAAPAAGKQRVPPGAPDKGFGTLQIGGDQSGRSDGPEIAEIARALGGQVIGSNQVLAPGPFHSAQDRSLSVRFDPSAADGFIVHSFAFDDFKDCRDYIRERLQAWFMEDGEGGWTISAGVRSEPKEDVKVEPNYRAVRLWREAEDPPRHLFRAISSCPRVRAYGQYCRRCFTASPTLHVGR